LFRRGRQVVALATHEAMAREASAQCALDAAGVDAWSSALALWRAKKWLPLHSTCLQTALALQMLFDAKGVSATIRVGVAGGPLAHAWVEVGDFVLDDQGLSDRFAMFDVPALDAECADDAWHPAGTAAAHRVGRG
jgi:Transglutaminase-like superfamily